MNKWDNYVSQLDILRRASDEDLQNEFIMSGIINKFTLQFELAWKTLKETLIYEGALPQDTSSPRQILKLAARYYPFINEEVWLSMLVERNQVIHIYDESVAKAAVERIINTYVPEFTALERNLRSLYEGNLF